MAIVVRDVAADRPGGGRLFTDVSFRVGDGECAGLVGPNGAGKSTLLRMLAGRLPVTEGTTQVDGRLAYMPQQIGVIQDDTVVRQLLASLSSPLVSERAAALVAAESDFDRSRTDATGLQLAEAIARWDEAGGFQQEAAWDRITTQVLRQPFHAAGSRRVGELSGGEQKRLALEALMISDADALLLDEPDNFLDIAGKRWLERHLKAADKAVLLVSHDRQLLSYAAKKIITLEATGAWVHGGSYSDYGEAVAARRERLEDAVRRWKEEERRLYRHFRWMKQRAAMNAENASQANAAQTRWNRYVEQGPPTAPPKPQRVRMRLKGAESGRRVLECAGLEVFGLTDPFDISVYYGERVAVVGPNGSGKSHFIRLIGGETEIEHGGAFRLGSRVQAGLFSQTHEHPEWFGKQVMEIVEPLHPERSAAMAALSRYGLQHAFFQRFETLSGGQQARLQVMLLEQQGVNLLLLDEPTDNLDIDSAEALERALDELKGTVLAVTHDRWFMRSFDRFLLFDYSGAVTEFTDLDRVVDVLNKVAA
jgi:ATPase subunit of ABC transporter with duplicated ATPase domains